jgi:8-oxo-dGTP pyrophosphatase MutT (NUDIX family)
MKLDTHYSSFIVHNLAGNLDGQESEIDTAVRETNEETGYIVGDYTPYIQHHIYFEV